MTREIPEVELEKFIDNHSLQYVLEQIVYICREKEEHVRSNWQDNKLAQTWRWDAHHVEKILDKIKN